MATALDNSFSPAWVPYTSQFLEIRIHNVEVGARPPTENHLGWVGRSHPIKACICLHREFVIALPLVLFLRVLVLLLLLL